MSTHSRAFRRSTTSVHTLFWKVLHLRKCTVIMHWNSGSNSSDKCFAFVELDYKKTARNQSLKVGDTLRITRLSRTEEFR